jgi:hypothetical protein
MNQHRPAPGPRLSAETIHASTVASNGRAVLITGPSGSGKSDLALRLLERGFTLVSDDPAAPRRQPRAAGPWREAAADQHRRDDRVGGSQGCARPRPNGPQALGVAAVSSRRTLPRLLLVTGMSGAGKSTVLDALEDMGWDIVDNLPADLLAEFVHGRDLCRTSNAAVGMDVRSRGFDPETLGDIFHAVEGVEPEILYLDCSGGELIRRYDETRRLHPLAPDRGRRAGPFLSGTGARLGRDDGPYRIASHRLDSPLLGRGQKLRNRRIWMYRRAAPLGCRGCRDGGTVASCRICTECPPP